MLYDLVRHVTKENKSNNKKSRGRELRLTAMDIVCVEKLTELTIAKRVDELNKWVTMAMAQQKGIQATRFAYAWAGLGGWQ